jgi:uncharacterized protein YecT (DUF1311 family)
MSKRDLVTEILEVRARAGEKSRVEIELLLLRDRWRRQSSALGGVEDFFPIRAVTLLEVFCRKWIAEVVDHGAPFMENAAALVSSVKLDYGFAQALHGKRLSLGELVAHTVSLNRFEQLLANFTSVLGKDFGESLRTVHDRAEVELFKKPQVPIVSDFGLLAQRLQRLLEVRHILVHERPSEAPYAVDEIEGFLAAAVAFMRATDQICLTARFGGYPMTTLGMMDGVRERLRAATEELNSVLEQVKAHAHADRLAASQLAWEQYRHAQSELRAAHLEGGTYQPLLYGQEEIRLTELRTEELRWWLTRRDGAI